jgi:hypothetical protein
VIFSKNNCYVICLIQILVLSLNYQKNIINNLISTVMIKVIEITKFNKLWEMVITNSENNIISSIYAHKKADLLCTIKSHGYVMQ